MVQMKNHVSSSLIPLRPNVALIIANTIVMTVRENMARMAALCCRLICTFHKGLIGTNKTKGDASALLDTGTSVLITYSGSRWRNRTRLGCEGPCVLMQPPYFDHNVLSNIMTWPGGMAKYSHFECLQGNNNTLREIIKPATVSIETLHQIIFWPFT